MSVTSTTKATENTVLNTKIENDKLGETSKKQELRFFDISEKARQQRALQKAEEELEKNRQKRKGVDKDAFMKLFVAQMKNQDPMEPLSNEQFITQMSQLSSVEQLSNLNTQFTKFAKKFDSFDKIGDLSKSIENLANKFNLENEKSEFSKFLALYEKTNSDLLKKISSLEDEIKKLKSV